MNHRREIDGMRGVAVLLVLLFHFDLVPFAKGGFIGVDVFFVISGFLISSIIWTQLDRRTFSLRGFYLRRFRRLAPALVCVQLLLLAGSYLLLLPGETRALAAQSLATQFYAINFYLWRQVNYFGLQSGGVVLLHCWSLAIEEQFYLLYPLLLLVVHRYARHRLAIALTLLALSSFVLNVLLIRRKPQATFYLLPTRGWELWTGALIPFAQQRLAGLRGVRNLLGGIGALGIGASAVFFGPGTSFPGYNALLPVLASAALLASFAEGGSWATKLLRARPIAYIGQVSYSLYLVHWPIRVLATYFIPSYTLGWRCGSLLLAFLLATTLFHTVEDPIRKGVFLSAPSRFFLLYAAASIAVVALSMTAWTSRGWRHRFDPAVLKLADAAEDQDEQARICEYRKDHWPSATGPCRIGMPSATTTWAVVGDSHAWALSRAFSLFLDHRHEAGVLAFAHGCMPIEGMGDTNCIAFVSDLHAWIRREKGVQNVVLVSIWRQPIDGLPLADGRFVSGEEAFVAFHDGFDKTLRDLRAAGKNVHIWESLPAAKMPVPSALARNRAFGLHLQIEENPREHEQLFRFLKDALDRNRAFVRGAISPLASMCRTTGCAVESNGAPLYFDDNHPAYSRAPYYARILEEQLGASLSSRP